MSDGFTQRYLQCSIIEVIAHYSKHIHVLSHLSVNVSVVSDQQA